MTRPTWKWEQEGCEHGREKAWTIDPEKVIGGGVGSSVREAVDQIANEFEFKTAEQVYSSFLYKRPTHLIFSFVRFREDVTKKTLFLLGTAPHPCTQQLVHPFATRNIFFSNRVKMIIFLVHM